MFFDDRDRNDRTKQDVRAIPLQNDSSIVVSNDSYIILREQKCYSEITELYIYIYAIRNTVWPLDTIYNIYIIYIYI